MHKRSSYEGAGVSEITPTQSRQLHIARKINQYYREKGDVTILACSRTNDRWLASLRYRRDIQRRPRVAEPFLYMVPRGGIFAP